MNNLLHKRNKKNEWKVYLPLYSGLLMMSISHLHSHSGLNGTLQIFNRFYTMPNKTNAAELVISSCKGCILARANYEPKDEYPEGRLKHGKHIIDIIAVDFFRIKASNTKFRQKFEWIMCITDTFSHFTTLYGQPNLNTNYTLRNLENYFATFGAPNEIRTDMGTNLCPNKAVQKLCKQHGVRCMLGLSYHSQGRGQIERANKVAKDSIIILAESLKLPQASVIHEAQFLTNSVPRTYERDSLEGPVKIKKSAYEVMFGVPPYEANLIAGHPDKEGMRSAMRQLNSLIGARNARLNKEFQARENEFKGKLKVGDMILVRNLLRKAHAWASNIRKIFTKL